jgi:hypothetical protein
VSDEHLELLRRIAKDVADIKAAMAASVGASAAALGVSTTSGGGGAKAGGAATDEQLDAPYGDPQIRFDPKRWDGESYVGCTFSQTTPEYLDCLASFKEWSAKKDEESGAKESKGRPKFHWAVKEAKLARGWARRMRAGWKPKGAANEPTDDDYGDGFGGGADDIPFVENMTISGRWWRP